MNQKKNILCLATLLFTFSLNGIPSELTRERVQKMEMQMSYMEAVMNGTLEIYESDGIDRIAIPHWRDKSSHYSIFQNELPQLTQEIRQAVEEKRKNQGKQLHTLRKRLSLLRTSPNKESRPQAIISITDAFQVQIERFAIFLAPQLKNERNIKSKIRDITKNNKSPTREQLTEERKNLFAILMRLNAIQHTPLDTSDLFNATRQKQEELKTIPIKSLDEALVEWEYNKLVEEVRFNRLIKPVNDFMIQK